MYGEVQTPLKASMQFLGRGALGPKPGFGFGDEPAECLRNIPQIVPIFCKPGGALDGPWRDVARSCLRRRQVRVFVEGTLARRVRQRG